MTQVSDAFQYVNRAGEYMLTAPDEAFDWIYMFTESDWILVEEVWTDRPAVWREAFAYIVCEGPAGPSRSILLRALSDESREVAIQAAQSLLSQEELRDEDWTPLDQETKKIVEALASED